MMDSFSSIDLQRGYMYEFTDNNFNIYPNPEQRNPDHVGSIKKTWNHPEPDPA